MLRHDAAEIGHLVAAGRTGCSEHVTGLHRAGRRQQLTVSDGDGNIVMLARVAEGTRHATAAGIQIDYGRAGNAAQECFRSIQQAHRFLMAVSVQ